MPLTRIAATVLWVLFTATVIGCGGKSIPEYCQTTPEERKQARQQLSDFDKEFSTEAFRAVLGHSELDSSIVELYLEAGIAGQIHQAAIKKSNLDGLDKLTRWEVLFLSMTAERFDHKVSIVKRIRQCGVDLKFDIPRDVATELIHWIRPWNVEIVNVKNLQPIHLAVGSESQQLVQYLLNHGVDPNSTATLITRDHTLNAVTPLHFAVNGGHTNIVEILVQNGAKVNNPLQIKGGNELPRTPLELALAGGHSQIAEYLREHGASEPTEQFERTLLIRQAKETISTIRTAIVQCQMMADCRNNSIESLVEHKLIEEEIEAKARILSEEGEPTQIHYKLGFEWDDSHGNRGQTMVYDINQGQFMAK